MMKTRRLRQALCHLRQVVAPAAADRFDAELMERFINAHDEAAFARLVERHGPLVLGVCRRVLQNHHDAEDAFQATFLVLARKARHIRQRDALSGWLYKVAYHLSFQVSWSAAGRAAQASGRPAHLERPAPGAGRGTRPASGEIPGPAAAVLPRGPHAGRGGQANGLDPGRAQDAAGARPAAFARAARPPRPVGLGRAADD